MFSLDWLDQGNFAEVNKMIAADVTRDVATRHFIASPDEIRHLQPAPATSAHPDTRRFGFNPLLSRPVIKDLAGSLFVPVPGMLARKVSLLGLYYTGIARWGTRFAQDLGTLFESYVGRQLRLLPDADVYPAIIYGSDKRESVDWIVTVDGVTFLVEVKSTRPSEAVRTGDDDAATDLRKYLGRAVEQIATTAQLIREGNPAFRNIPQGNPIVGLVVTMEPFHVVNAPPYRELLPDCPEPVVVCSASELEGLVALKDVSAGQVLLAHVQDPARQGWSVGSALAEHGHPENAVFREAWEQLPWARAEDGVDASVT